MLRWPTLKDVLAFVGGGAILYHETALSDQPAQTVLVYAGLGLMFGAPVVFRFLDIWGANGRNRRDRDEDDGA